MNEIAKLIIDNYNGDLPAKFEATTQADRDNMLRQEMLDVLGMKKYDAVSFRKAMRNPAKSIAIYEIIENLSGQGVAVLMVSSDIAEVLRVAHRIIVMREGRIAKEFNDGVATQEDILMASSGFHSGREEVQ